MNDLDATILAALSSVSAPGASQAPGATCESAGHVLTDDRTCAACGAEFPVGRTVPIRRWIRATDKDGRDTSYWAPVLAEAEAVRKAARRHIPNVATPSTPQDDATPGITDRTVFTVPAGIAEDMRRTAFSEQVSGLLLDKPMPRKPTMRTRHAPSYVPAPGSLCDDDTAEFRARMQDVGYARRGAAAARVLARVADMPTTVDQQILAYLMNGR